MNAPVTTEHSSDVCQSETFHGPSPASEPETQVMQEQADTLDIMVWASYHTAVPAWLLPYGHRIDGVCQIPDNYDDEMVNAPLVYSVASTSLDLTWAMRRNTWIKKTLV